MQWYELAVNPLAISEIYTVVPALEQMHLEEVCFDERPRITLMLDMTVFPEKVPTRWKQRGYNTLTLQLDFWNIESIQVMRWSKENIVDVHIERTTNSWIEMEALSESCYVHLVAHDFLIALHKSVRAN